MSEENEVLIVITSRDKADYLMKSSIRNVAPKEVYRGKHSDELKKFLATDRNKFENVRKKKVI